MKQERKYFVFNKERDYRQGFLENMEWGPGGLVSQGKRGGFLSRVLDSREKGMEWHRLVFSDGGARVPCRVTVFAGDGLDLGGERDVRGLIASPELGFSEKLQRMGRFMKKMEAGKNDILLLGVRGRYLWFALEVFPKAGDPVSIDGLMVYFPHHSWVSYLPEVYQSKDKDRFLERYLAIFQTLYEEMDRRIRDIPQLFDVGSAGREYMEWLAGWLDIAGCYMWSEEQLGRLLAGGARLYRKRGTREGILGFIRLYTGGDAWLVEFYDLEAFMRQQGQRESLARLYGGNPYVFSVILKKEAVPTQKEYRTVLRVIEEAKPAQIEARLIVLEPYMYLGGHTYLGINSAFGEYRELVLDGRSMLPFSKLS